MFRFRAHIGVLTNITPDHLDRYDYCFQNYVDAKMRITQNQNSRDFFIYSGDDEVIWQQLPKYDLRMKQAPLRGQKRRGERRRRCVPSGRKIHRNCRPGVGGDRHGQNADSRAAQRL